MDSYILSVNLKNNRPMQGETPYVYLEFEGTPSQLAAIIAAFENVSGRMSLESVSIDKDE